MRYPKIGSWSRELPSYNIQDVERSEHQLGIANKSAHRILPGIALLVVLAIWLVYTRKPGEARAR
jgi:hypothetical protein